MQNEVRITDRDMFQGMAGKQEEIKCERIGGTIYVYGSELACLRIYYRYRFSLETAAVGQSENMKSWYFRLEMKF
jgi:hypothetical protein